MTSPTRFRRIDELFRAASAIDAFAQRKAFLNQQCGSDAQLLAEVLALLAEDGRDQGVLDAPAFNATAILSSIGAAAPNGPLPDMVGRYRVIRELGRGGMGIVYEAIQANPHRTVALKVINSGSSSQSMLRRFEREAELLGRLQHPGIAAIFEAGAFEPADGSHSRPFFAMELVRGRPLNRFAEESSWPTRRRLELIARICDAVDHAHQRGVIHRDLKPSNILVDDTGQPRILDFGIARAVDADTHTLTMRTDVGQLIGTISYMSPEQAAGNPAKIDARSDIYSIGVIAYELLTGRLPHNLDHKLIHEAARIICEDEPTPLSAVNRTLRGDVDTIIGTALEKDPARRYQSAGDMARDIRRHLADQPITARPPSAIYQLRKFARRNKAIVGGVAAGFALMLIGLVVSMKETRDARAAQALAEQKTLEAMHQSVRATLVAAALEIDSGDAAAAFRRLQGIDPAERNYEWRHLNARLDDSVARIEDDSRIVGAHLAPDGREVLTLSRDGQLRRWDARKAIAIDSQPLCDAPVVNAAFSADGARVVAVVESEGFRVLAWESVDSSPVNLGMIGRNPRLLEMSPSGRWAALAIGATGFELFDVDARTRQVMKTMGTVQNLRFVAGDRLARANAGSVQVIDCASGDPVHDLRVETGDLAVDCSTDGSLLLFGGSDRTVHVLDLASGRETRRLPGHSGAVRGVRFVPQSSLICSIAQDQSVLVWDAQTGEIARRFLSPDRSFYTLMFDAAGSTFITRSRDLVNVWDLHVNRDEVNVLDHESYVYAVAFTPDGRRIVTAGWDGAIRIWDAATRQPIRIIRDDHGFVTAIAVSPDGRFIVSGHHVGSGQRAPLRLWDAATGALVHDFPRLTGEAKAIVFDPQGHRFAIVRTHAPLAVYDMLTRQSTTLAPRRKAMSNCLAWSGDGQRIAACYADGVVQVLTADSGDRLREFTLDRSWANDCAFNSDGRLLATAAADGTIRLWDVGSGECLRTLRGHSDVVFAVAFSPDGSRLASGSRDTTIRLWDVDSGDEMIQLRGHTQYVYDLAFSPDGSMLLSGSGDATARVWDTQPLHVQQQALAAGSNR